MNKFDAGYPPRHRMLINVYVRQQLKYWTVFDLLNSRIDLDRAVIWSFKRLITERRDLEVNAPSVSRKIRNREVQIKFQILVVSHWRNFRMDKFSTVWGQYMVAKERTQFTICHTSNLIIDAVLEFSQTAPLQAFHETWKSRPQMNFDSLNWISRRSQVTTYKVDVLNVFEGSEWTGICGYPDCITSWPALCRLVHCKKLWQKYECPARALF